MAFYGRRSYRRRGGRRSSYGAYKRGFRAANYKRNWGRIKRGTPEGIKMFGETKKLATEEQLATRKALGIQGRGMYGSQVCGRGAYFDEFGKGSTWLSGNTMNINTGTMGGKGAYVWNDKINGLPNQDEKAIVVQNSEYIQDIVSTSTGFTTLFSTPINPGLSGIFPWLSQLAQFYENYEMIQLIFEFRSMVTDGNNTAAGNVIFATQSNPLAADFTTKQIMENYNSSKSCKVTDSMLFGIECDPSKMAENALQYVRKGLVPAGEDAKTYDLSKIQISITGVPTGLSLGELWVHYKVKFVTPKVTVQTDPYMYGIRAGAGITAARPFGTVTTPTRFDALPGTSDLLGLVYNTPTATTFTIGWQQTQKQRYLIRYAATKSGASTVNMDFTVTNGIIISELASFETASATTELGWCLIETQLTGLCQVTVTCTDVAVAGIQLIVESTSNLQTY